MKRINLVEYPLDTTALLALAQEGPVVLLAPNGKEYVLAEADTFDQEIEQLRNSQAFQAFLEQRAAKGRPRRALTAVMQDIEAELASNATSTETDI
jgi:hypothetical protein